MNALLHETPSFPYPNFEQRSKRENQFRGNSPVEIKDKRKKEKREEGKDPNKTDDLKGGPNSLLAKVSLDREKSLTCSSSLYSQSSNCK